MLRLTDDQLNWRLERIPDPPKSTKGERPAEDKRKVLRGICTNYPPRMKRAAWPVPTERDWDHYIPAKYRHADYYKPLKSGE